MKPAIPLLCTALLILCAFGLAVQQHMQHTAQLAAITALFERLPQMTIKAHDAWKHEQSERESHLAAWKLEWNKKEREAAELAAALKHIPAHVTDPALRERAAKELVKIEREALRHPQPGETETERIIREAKNFIESSYPQSSYPTQSTR